MFLFRVSGSRLEGEPREARRHAGTLPKSAVQVHVPSIHRDPIIIRNPIQV